MNIEDALFENNEGNNLLFENDWKKNLEYVKNNLDENKKEYIDYIIDIVLILINYGDTYESDVLNTAILIIFDKLKHNDKYKAINKYDTLMIERINIFNKDKDWKIHIKNVMNNQKYRYLKKIELSIILENILIAKKNNKQDILLKEKEKFDYVTNLYSDMLPKNLVEKIEKEL